ncbi:hypothetical protein [Actinokineospora iranica]|uniref:Alanine and proline-rich secreted protein Apa n=1 Tax=Actinokineospora iranica TaxID=1271860 RepID=A0A1G6Y586_9PSEU|nr:hypothetical protein [Actinokineospora iranica]SDD85579.1 hypothetical protein SAMN05216174_12033 [Actinokineospora iranica]
MSEDSRGPWPGQFAPPQRFLAPVPPPPPKSTRLWVGLSALAAVLLAAVTWLVVATTTGPSGAPAADVDQGTSVVTARDGRSRLTLPTQWKELPPEYRGEASVLTYGQIYQERYVMVITDEKAGFADFADFEETAIDSMAAMPDYATVDQGEELTVGGHPAVRYEVTTKITGVDALFWYTLVNGENGYYQVISWTLAERRESAEPALRQIVSTFEEIPG